MHQNSPFWAKNRKKYGEMAHPLPDPSQVRKGHGWGGGWELGDIPPHTPHSSRLQCLTATATPLPGIQSILCKLFVTCPWSLLRAFRTLDVYIRLKSYNKSTRETGARSIIWTAADTQNCSLVSTLQYRCVYDSRRGRHPWPVAAIICDMPQRLASHFDAACCMI